MSFAFSDKCLGWRSSGPKAYFLYLCHLLRNKPETPSSQTHPSSLPDPRGAAELRDALVVHFSAADIHKDGRHIYTSSKCTKVKPEYSEIEYRRCHFRSRGYNSEEAEETC